MVLTHALDGVGNTPLVHLRVAGIEHVDTFAKLELCNPTGSVKDRAARYLVETLLAEGTLDPSVLVVESSSGNFGVALAAVCARHGLRFCCVVDPRISFVNEMLIRSLGAEVVCVDELDPTGGYLQSRIRKVQAIVASAGRAYWVNQYENPLNAEAYYATLGEELCAELPHLDYAFVGVSSGGTITGLSRKLKERFPGVTIVAVDTVGSIIFGGPGASRWIPGIGASIVPAILKHARIDDAVMVDEGAAVHACHELLRSHQLFVGGSSGTAFAAMRSYFRDRTFERRPVAVTIFPDRGDRYADTVFDRDWCAKLFAGRLSTRAEERVKCFT